MPESTTTTATSSKVYTMEEISKHTAPDSCWFVIHDKVYDVSKFLDEVRRGRELLYYLVMLLDLPLLVVLYFLKVISRVLGGSTGRDVFEVMVVVVVVVVNI